MKFELTQYSVIVLLLAIAIGVSINPYIITQMKSSKNNPRPDTRFNPSIAIVKNIN